MLPLSPADLAQAGGIVRCGSCGRTLNALSELYAYPPDKGDSPIISDGMPPLLTPRVEQEEIREADDKPSYGVDRDSSDDTDERTTKPPSTPDIEVLRPTAPGWLRFFWPGLAALLAVLLLLQLFGPEQWRVDWSGFSSDTTETIAMDDVIQVVSRDLHRHPTLNDAVVISAVLVNRSDETVRWPEIEVRLFDASQQVIGERRLRPEEYMSNDADVDNGFAADMRLPIVLEMVTEASTATGFSLAFF